MQDDAYIITKGSDNHLQRRNKLKGTAMQKLILTTIPAQKDDLSLQKILAVIRGHKEVFYTVHEPFQVQENKKTYNIKNEIIGTEELPQSCTVLTKNKIVDKKWKICDNCGQYIYAQSQKTKKCRKCKKGWFHFKTTILENWTPLTNGQPQGVLAKLEQEGYVKKIAGLSKRPDFFHYSNGIFYIFESKNKEITGLSFKDLITSLIYPLRLKKCGYDVKELVIIFNGHFTGELEEQVQKGYADKYDFKVQFQPIEKYLAEKNVNVSQIKVSKNAKGKYEYKFTEGKTNNIIIDIQEPNEGEKK